MKKRLVVSFALIFCFVWCTRLSASLEEAKPEKETVKKVIVDAYIDGVFNKGDASLIKKGWHPDSDVLVLSKGNLSKLSAYSYIDGFEKNPGPLHAGTTYEFTDVHVTESAASAIVEIFQEGKHIYTDYILLYRFEDGWKIVTKIYYRYPKD